ncbi:Fanconi anemia core complex-associated protein 100 [Melanotaenia boesemani]|uniref:Fanconi anemia core complex-associated protein 100 n=1 Tax=Melanotaenia boesemani TaxID=1250792 RepID=UPI001C047FC9|nr:Fanconi anemia core complex-associated protein 100 [Melanotaenia boesemani]
MEERCAVETWAEFGFLETLNTPNIKYGVGTDVFVCTGSDEVYIFSAHERKLMGVLQFPGPVSDLVENHDKQLIFVACRSGVYCVSFHSLLPRSQVPSACAFPSPTVLKISTEFLVVGTDGASALLLIGSVLLGLCQRDGSWLLTLYKTPQQTQSKHSAYEVLSSFSLPLVLPVVQGTTESKTGLTRTPVLVCVHSGDMTQSSFDAASAHAHFQLEPVLFKLLFGVEAALAKSPVVLCGLPDGRICFLPLHLPGSRLQVLHSLEQPVVFVGTSVVTGTDTGPAQCLVAVGEQGRVVLIKTDKGGPERGGIVAGFTEGCVSGPVKCVCVDKNSVYYSTGSDLFKLNMSEGSPGRGEKEVDKEASRPMAATFQSPSSLNVCRIIALAEPTCNAAGEIQLLGLSVRGQLQRISLPVKSQDEALSKLPSSHVGHNVRDFLSAIGNVCERASVLETIIKSKNQILRKLNQVVHISFLLTASTNTEEHHPVQEKPIRCHATASWSRLLQKDSLNLTCILDNSSPYILEQGWTLCVSVSPLSYSSTAGKETSSTNFSFSFHTLCPNETLEVTLPVAAAGETSFPLTINCSLMFSLLALLGEEELAAFPDLQRSCFSLPLNTLTVDWLHTLRVISPTPAHRMTTSQSSSFMGSGVQAFLNSHQFRCSRGTDRGGESASKPESYSASVCISSELLRDTLKSKSFDFDHKGPELAHQHLCFTLLDWLLSGGAGGVQMARKGDEIDSSSSVVHARCPNEATVKLTAKEVNVGEESPGKENSLMSIEVYIESSSIAAVCGLHHALLCRMQTLLQRATERTASTKGVQNLVLSRALQRAKMQQSQISQAFSVGMSSGQVNRFLVGVYQELRENPLLII